MRLVRPATEHLESYRDALTRGWYPDNTRPESSADELALIDADVTRFLESHDDLDAKGPPIHLPDGSTTARLPGFRRWLWDGEFCGAIGFRWQPGGEALPPTCLGHLGYTVVSWKRARGYASEALRLMLVEIQALPLRYVELTTLPDNVPSQRVIEANGGVLLERFQLPEAFGSGEALRYRISLR